VTLDRRLSAVETSLGPKELVLDWLTDAQAYPTMGVYVDALLEGDPTAMPLDRLVSAAQRNARTRARGSAKEVRVLIEREVRTTVFLFFVVHQSWVTVEEQLSRQPAIQALISTQLAVALGDQGEKASIEVGLLRRVVGFALRSADELAATDAALERVAERYLDGRSVLLPGTDEAWQADLAASARLAAMALRIGELEGIDVGELSSGPIEERTASLATRHVAIARTKTYDLVGDGPRLLVALRDWIGGQAPAPVPGSTL
jgi:hypothetical protein